MSTACITLFYHVVPVKFFCINTSIDTFFSKLRAFLAEEGRPVIVKRKLDGAGDESLAGIEKFVNRTRLYLPCEKSG